MNRRAFLYASIAALARPLVVEAQQVERLVKVAVISVGSPTAPLSQEGRKAFETGLRELGWIPGSNITIDYRFADGDFKRLARDVAEVVGAQPDVIVARTGVAQQAILHATKTIPIVFAGASDPVGAGWVKSLAQPGGNATGLTLRVQALMGKQLEILRDAVPKLARAAVLGNPSGSARAVYDGDTGHVEDAGRLLGVAVQHVAVKSEAELPQAFAAMARQRTDALLVRTDPQVLERHVARLVALAADHRLPTLYPWRQYVEAGGLMSYSVNLNHVHRRSAIFVDKIIKGAKPADLPVEQPTKFDLVINLKTAKTLGLTIPPSLLLRADQIIE